MRDERRAVRWWEHTQRVVEGAQVVDLVEVLRLPQRGDEPVAGGDPLVDRADDRLQVADLVAPAGRVQPVLAHELLGTHRQAGTGRGALHDEGRHPPDHLGPGEVGQGRHEVGGDVARHRPEEPRAVEQRGDLHDPVADLLPVVPCPPGSQLSANSCSSPRSSSGYISGCGPSRTSTSWPRRSRTSSTTAAATWWNDSSIRPRTIGPGARLRHAGLLTSVATGARRGAAPRRRRGRARPGRGSSGAGSAASARSRSPTARTGPRRPT